jgi:hypothetical protein
MRFGTRNVRSLYWVGSLVTVSKEVTRYTLNLMGIQIMWDRRGPEPAI